jgi:acetyltransferase-like isoleucine patch superfamily enzyme
MFQYKIDLVYRGIIRFLGLRNYIYAFWWGVKIGKNNKFDGKCYFKRYPHTQISIGDSCKFKSRADSNLIGINRPCIISTLSSNFNATIIIGNNCGFSGTVIGAHKSITIGNNVRCGANTVISDSDWHIEDSRIGGPAEVRIEDNVWLGEDVKVLKGVTIGKNSVIGTGSIVTKNIPENVIAAGNPCRILRSL